MSRSAPLSLLCLSLAAAAPAAAETAEPMQIVSSAVNEVMETLRTETLTRAERITRIRGIADRVFDWAEMARRSLGPYWNEIDDGQRKRFTTVFEDLLARQHVTDFDRFVGDEEVQMGEAEVSEDTAHVTSHLITHSHERVPITYELHRTGGTWRIYDVSIEGVSLVNHFRSAFHRRLVNQSFDEMLQTLERKQRALAGPEGSR